MATVPNERDQIEAPEIGQLTAKALSRQIEELTERVERLEGFLKSFGVHFKGSNTNGLEECWIGFGEPPFEKEGSRKQNLPWGSSIPPGP